MSLLAAAVIALPGSGATDVSSLSAVGEPGLADIEDLRREAVDDASRAADRSPEPRSMPEEEPAQATPTLEPSVPESGSADETPEEATDDDAGEPAEDESTAESQRAASRSSLPGGFAPVAGCDAEVPAKGSVGNGELGDAHLCDVGDGHLLRPDAAAAFLALAEAYESSRGESLLSCVGNTYRSYEAQANLFQEKPNLAARPGTSEHGWGLAIDFECGADSYDSSFYAWLSDHGEEFGWVNPPWAQQGGSRPEPWHWEFEADLLS
ncbi:M15 family metallopeptidase [Phytoactinopolyspora mesophila]|nr:M15 family metallopeptidase [Phytoactinopolyspora mesophila]